MNHALAFMIVAAGLASGACATPVPLDHLHTPPIISSGQVFCSAVNTSPSPLFVAVEILDAQGGAINPNLSCGALPGRHSCRVETQSSPDPRLLYCRIAVPGGKKDLVRGALTSEGRVGEAR